MSAFVERVPNWTESMFSAGMNTGHSGALVQLLSHRTWLCCCCRCWWRWRVTWVSILSRRVSSRTSGCGSGATAWRRASPSRSRAASLSRRASARRCAQCYIQPPAVDSAETHSVTYSLQRWTRLRRTLVLLNPCRLCQSVPDNPWSLLRRS